MQRIRSKTGPIDRPLAFLIAILVVGGCMIFASAAFGLLARGTIGIPSVVFNHLVLGVGAGFAALIATASIDYRAWRRFAPYLYGGAIFLTALVFVPHVGAVYEGGQRWIVVFHFSFQPSELMKIGSIVMAAAYFSTIKQKTATLHYGLGGMCAILALPALFLVAQPDLGTLGVICVSVLAVFWVAGARWWHITALVAGGIVAIGLLALVQPYVRARVETFLHPSQGQQTQSYQIKQSLIAIGSGEIVGRGFGQGIQKFTYLPEPMGDSIFAVAGEELGFVGACIIIVLFLAFALRGFGVSARAPDTFGALLGIGIATYLGSEAFINIAAMIGIAPLTGIPLTFVSQGGSAMLASLASAGILLNVSRHMTHKKTA